MVERVLRLEGRGNEPALLLRCLAGTGWPVLYVHGASFPSALSVGYRFHGRSWMDDLVAHGFDAWAFDFAGYGGSDRYPEMDGPREGAPLGRAPAASRQIERAVAYIVEATGHERVFLVAHSWGSIPAGLYAGGHPERVAALCLFGPVVQRQMPDIPEPESVGAWRTVTVEQQLTRFIEDVPPNHPPVLIEEALELLGAGLSGDRSVRAVAHAAVGEDTHGPAGRLSRGVERSIALQAETNSGAYAHRPRRVG